jgi:cytoskeletal protein CcmA (bactofilin family)
MLKSFMQSGNTGNTSNARTDTNKPAQPAYAPGRTTESARTAEPARVTEPAKVETAPVDSANEEGSKLIVGPNIKLKGSEITDCEILVVEGRVEASMKSRVIRIAEGGVFAGKAEIDVAEVYGNFEGELTARTRLVIHATGKVSGVIRYGAMMVEEGGTISGEVATLTTGPSLVKVPEAAAQTVTPAAVAEKASEAEQVHSLSSLARNQVVAKRQG